MTTRSATKAELIEENGELRARLTEIEETLRAIRDGEVDALVMTGNVYTLEGAESPYRRLVEAMNEGAATLIEDGTIVYANHRLAALLEVQLENVMGSPLRRFVTADDLAAFDAAVKQGFDSFRRAQITLRRGSGATLPVQLSCSALDVQGLRGVCLIVTDLTEQRRNEAILASEALSRSILEQAAAGIVVCDTGGTIIRASREALRLAGHNCLFEPFAAAFPLEIPAAGGVAAMLTRVLAGETSHTLEARLPRRAPDSDAWLLVAAAPLLAGGESGCIVSMVEITDRKRADEKVAWLATFPELDPTPVIEVDRESGVVHYLNPAAMRLFPDLPTLGIHHPILAGLDGLVEALAREPGRPVHREIAVGGSWFRQTVHIQRGGRRVRIYAFDVSEGKKREEELQRLNRTLKADSESSHAMMRAADEGEYLREVCRVVAEDCGHAMVWIGYAEDDAGKTVRPVAHAGFEEGYLDTLHLTWADTERGRGPTGTAIRTRQPVVCRDMRTDPRFAPWRQEALKRGYASSVALPLKADGKAFGAIMIYSPQPDGFSDEEVGLLSALADDLAFGITTIRTRRAHGEAEEALRESEATLRGILDATTESIWLFGPDGTILLANDVAASRVGKARADLMGRRFHEVIPADVAASRMVRLKQVFETGRPVEFEDERAGMRFLHNFYPVNGGDGRVVSVVSFSREITERRLAEERLRESEARYRNLFENMTEEVHFWRLVRDRAGRISTWRLVDANPPALSTWGRPLDACVGRTPDEIFGPGSTDHLMPVVRKIMSEGVPHSYEDYFPGLDRHFRFTSVPLGEHFITTGADITALKRAEQEVRREKDRLAALVESIPDEIWFADLDRRFTLANPSALREFGLSEFSGFDIEKFAAGLEVLRPDGEPRPVDEAPPLRALEGEIIRNEDEIVRTPVRGELRYRQVSATPVRGHDGSIIGSVSVVRDVTDLKLAERQREELLRDVQEQRARLQAIVDSLPVGLWIVEAGGRMVFVNHIADEIWRGTAPRLESVAEYGEYKAWAAGTGERIHGEEMPLTRALEGESVRNELLDIERFDGTRGSQLVSAEPVRSAEGGIVGAVAVVLDITERQQAEEEIRRRAEDLRIANQELERFNRAMVGRELRVIELKREVNELCLKAGEVPPYAVGAAGDAGNGVGHERS